MLVFLTNRGEIIETKFLCLTKCGKLDINSVSFKQIHILGHKETEREQKIAYRKLRIS